MSFILKNTNVSLKKKSNSFFIEINNTNLNNNKVLYDSLVDVCIKNMITQQKCIKTNTCNIEFNADSVRILKNVIQSKDFFQYNDLIHLFSCIKNQLDFLKKNNLGILFFNINDIVAIKHDEKYYFAFLNSENMFPIREDNLYVTKSFDKSDKNIFISPELLSYNSIPFNINYKSCYFSLSLLIAYCIEGKKIDYLNPTSWNFDDYNKILECIHDTKLYWALMRCQEKLPENRYLLLI